MSTTNSAPNGASTLNGAATQNGAPASNGAAPQPIDGKRGASILGPTNPAREAEGPDILASPSTDSGTVANLRWSFADSRNHLEPGGWGRQTTIRELPVATTLAGVNMRLTPGGAREMHWHTSAEWAYMIAGHARITAVDEQGLAFTPAELVRIWASMPHNSRPSKRTGRRSCPRKTPRFPTVQTQYAPSHLDTAPASDGQSAPKTLWEQGYLAASLALVSGYVDAYAFLNTKIYVSFMSGNTTQTGLQLGQSHLALAQQSFLPVALFVVGVFGATLLLHSRVSQPLRWLFAACAALLGPA